CLQNVLVARTQCEVVPPVSGRPLVTSTHGDRDNARVLECLYSVVQLVHRCGLFGNASGLKHRLAVPNALNTKLERQAVRGVTRLPSCYCATQASDVVAQYFGEIHEVTGLSLSDQLATAPLLEQVRSVTGLQRGG